MLLRVEDVGKVYRLGNQDVAALRNISLNVEDGAFLAIAGPSGSGKLTLLNLIGLLDSPSSGRILIDESVVSDRTPDELAAMPARRIGFIFPTFNLLLVFRPADNLEHPLLHFHTLYSDHPP